MEYIKASDLYNFSNSLSSRPYPTFEVRNVDDLDKIKPDEVNRGDTCYVSSEDYIYIASGVSDTQVSWAKTLIPTPSPSPSQISSMEIEEKKKNLKRDILKLGSLNDSVSRAIRDKLFHELEEIENNEKMDEAMNKLREVLQRNQRNWYDPVPCVSNSLYSSWVNAAGNIFNDYSRELLNYYNSQSEQNEDIKWDSLKNSSQSPSSYKDKYSKLMNVSSEKD